MGLTRARTPEGQFVLQRSLSVPFHCRKFRNSANRMSMIQIVLKCKNLFHELVFATDSIEEGLHLSLQEIQPPSRTFSGSVPHSISRGGSVVLTTLKRLQWRTEASRTGSKCRSPPGCLSVGEFPTHCRFTHGHVQWTKPKRQYSKSNSDSVL